MDTKIINGSQQADIFFVLAHGAGAGINTEFMTHIATSIVETDPNICVLRFGDWCFGSLVGY